MKRILFVAIAALMSNCGSQTDSELDSVADTSARWSNPGSIPVCFVDSAANYQQYRDSVQRSITTNYNKTNRIRFTGWGICGATSSTSTIRIKMGNPIPVSGGSILGCSHIGPGPSSYATCQNLLTNYSGPGFNMYIYPADAGTAVHEFGHAVGLRHEHARTDAPASCKTGEVAGKGGTIVYLTPTYDTQSVMGYCNNKSALSAGDISGLNQLYK